MSDAERINPEKLAAEMDPIAAAALALAGERPWREVNLKDIASRAGKTLPEMRDAGAESKADVLGLVIRAFDDAMLRGTARLDTHEGPRRDALFEVIMARFDAMQAHRSAIRSIFADATSDPKLMRAALGSARWMLEAAGIDSSGLEGGLRVTGLAGLYGSVLRTWLEDDDPGQARTMAALDRRLRRGERSLATLDELGRVARGLGDGVASLWRGKGSRPQSPAEASGGATSEAQHT